MGRFFVYFTNNILDKNEIDLLRFKNIELYNNMLMNSINATSEMGCGRISVYLEELAFLIFNLLTRGKELSASLHIANIYDSQFPVVLVQS